MRRRDLKHLIVEGRIFYFAPNTDMGKMTVIDQDGKEDTFFFKTQEELDKRGVGKLPSAHQMGDDVTLDFRKAGRVFDAEIIKIHFAGSKILYDVAVEVREGVYTRIYNIESDFVNKK